MKIAVLGASGQVGGHLMAQAARRGHEVVGTRHEHPIARLRPLDLGDAAAVREFMAAERPHVVFCTAGWSWVDGCERDPKKAFDLNVTNTMNAARASWEVGARFVWFSTDYVFPGAGPFYDEQSTPEPLNVYGSSKLAAEHALLEEGPPVLIVRTAVVYGPERQHKNAIYQLMKAHLEESRIKVAVDQVCNPTYSPNLAAASVELAERDVRGVIHVAGTDVVSRYDFALTACTILRLNEKILVPVRTEQLGAPARRPLNNALDVSKAQGLLRVPLVGCAEGLSAFVQEAPLQGLTRVLRV